MTTPPALRGISSMATRALLAELAAGYGSPVAIESVGGVDAARRVAAGEAFDVVMLASDAIDKLIDSGHARGRVDIVRSPVAVAVRAGARRPSIADEAAVKAAVADAPRLGYSTGPSGRFLLSLFERWGIAEAIAARTVQAPPGVPVGTLLARGEIDLAFQQLSELQGLPGVDVLGVLPPAIAHVTTFCGAVCARSQQPEAAAAWLRYTASKEHAGLKQRHGMEPA
jgi:molybdate transport system substrate-binding protein